MRLLFVVSLITALLCIPAVAQDIAYYRVASTQQTVIVSSAGDGTLVWTNSNPNSSCTVVWSFWLDGFWMSNAACSSIVTNGTAMSTFVQVPDRVPNKCACIHNLYRLLQAELSYKKDNNLSWGDYISPWSLLPYLGGKLPFCPDGGFYCLNNLGWDPTCNIAGHTL